MLRPEEMVTAGNGGAQSPTASGAPKIPKKEAQGNTTNKIGTICSINALHASSAGGAGSMLQRRTDLWRGEGRRHQASSAHSHAPIWIFRRSGLPKR
ncbi:hypothetical protein HMPREF9946_00713 [Acetobacteraceae bacterium AT-5844]|nr:hypothetical protein HMPREF9946_00713 [Acetobacteraceae bacterium AT-5844]